MLTRLKLKREGKLDESPIVGSRGRRASFPKYSRPVHPQVVEVVVDYSDTMSHEG